MVLAYPNVNIFALTGPDFDCREIEYNKTVPCGFKCYYHNPGCSKIYGLCLVRVAANCTVQQMQNRGPIVTIKVIDERGSYCYITNLYRPNRNSSKYSMFDYGYHCNADYFSY